MTKKSNRVKIFLHGVNIGRVFKACRDENIELFNINRTDYKNIEFEVQSKNKKKLEIIAQKNNYQISTNKGYGISKYWHFLLARIGIFAGIILFVLINIFANFFVWDIKIYGTENVQNQEILALLGQKNIKKGAIISKIAPEDVESTITNNIEKVSMCSVIKKGTTLIINIKEKMLASEIKNINGNGDIVAETNLTITEMDVVSGTALKSVGDSVKAGDVIVAGYILDTSGNKISCNANAKIKAKTWHSATEIYYKQVEVQNKTGKKIIVSNLSLFGTVFPIKTSQITFQNYIEETSEKYIQNNFLPIKMTTTTYFETMPEVVRQDFETDKQSILDRCQTLAGKKVKSNEIISKIFDVVTEEEDKFIVTSYVEVVFEI